MSGFQQFADQIIDLHRQAERIGNTLAASTNAHPRSRSASPKRFSYYAEIKVHEKKAIRKGSTGKPRTPKTKIKPIAGKVNAPKKQKPIAGKVNAPKKRKPIAGKVNAPKKLKSTAGKINAPKAPPKCRACRVPLKGHKCPKKK